MINFIPVDRFQHHHLICKQVSVERKPGDVTEMKHNSMGNKSAKTKSKSEKGATKDISEASPPEFSTIRDKFETIEQVLSFVTSVLIQFRCKKRYRKQVNETII